MRDNTKKEVFSFRTLVQKIRDYFKYTYHYYWSEPYPNEWQKIYNLKPLTFKKKWRDFIYKVEGTLRFKMWEFKESFKWHVKCYLVFWRLPKLLEAAMDGYVAAESYRDLNWESKDVLAEPFMDEIVDSLYYIRLKDKEYSEASDKEKQEIRTEIKEKYEQFGLRCPDEFLTVREIDDRDEEDYENERSGYPGGSDYDERPALIDIAEHQLKKYKFNSRYSYYQKYRGLDE